MATTIPIPEETAARVKDLRRSGMTFDAIASELGISVSSANKYGQGVAPALGIRAKKPGKKLGCFTVSAEVAELRTRIVDEFRCGSLEQHALLTERLRDLIGGSR